MPKLGRPPIRREQSIRATFGAIDEVGVANATITQIAGTAGFSTGTIGKCIDGDFNTTEVRHMACNYLDYHLPLNAH